jgi:hypothetical protein
MEWVRSVLLPKEPEKKVVHFFFSMRRKQKCHSFCVRKFVGINGMCLKMNSRRVMALGKRAFVLKNAPNATRLAKDKSVKRHIFQSLSGFRSAPERAITRRSQYLMVVGSEQRNVKNA